MTPSDNPELVDRPRRLLRLKRSSDGDSEIPKNGLKKSEVIEHLHVAEKVLNITSIVILGIFVVVVGALSSSLLINFERFIFFLKFNND